MNVGDSVTLKRNNGGSMNDVSWNRQFGGKKGTIKSQEGGGVIVVSVPGEGTTKVLVSQIEGASYSEYSEFRPGIQRPRLQ